MDQAQAKGAIETFIIDWPVLTFLGLLFGAFAPEQDPWRSRAFMAGFIATAVFTTTAFVSYTVAPDWMWMYFLDPDSVAWTLPSIALGYVGMYVLSFAAAIGLRAFGRRAVVVAAANALIAEVIVVAATWQRYRVVGTRQQWLAGTAHPLLGTSPEGPVRVIAPLGPLFAVVLIAGLIWAWRASRDATPADR